MKRTGKLFGDSAHALNRRQFLKLGLAGVAGLGLPAPALAGLLSPAGERALSFYNTHTGESVRTTYWAEGDYLPEGLKEIDFILRDFRANEVQAMDRSLLDLLYVMRNRLETRNPFQIISGYRSPATNAALRDRSNGVAKHSLHMEAKAIDIRLEGVPLANVRNAALSLKSGGVGYYPGSNFVHVDVGRVRQWVG